MKTFLAALIPVVASVVSSVISHCICKWLDRRSNDDN